MRAGSAWLRLGCCWICCDLTEIGGCLEAFVVKNGLGETYAAGTGFIIDTAPDTVRAPDVSFVARERAEATAEERGFSPAPPTSPLKSFRPTIDTAR